LTSSLEHKRNTLLPSSPAAWVARPLGFHKVGTRSATGTETLCGLGRPFFWTPLGPSKLSKERNRLPLPIYAGYSRMSRCTCYSPTLGPSAPPKDGHEIGVQKVDSMKPGGERIHDTQGCPGIHALGGHRERFGHDADQCEGRRRGWSSLPYLSIPQATLTLRVDCQGKQAGLKHPSLPVNP